MIQCWDLFLFIIVMVMIIFMLYNIYIFCMLLLYVYIVIIFILNNIVFNVLSANRKCYKNILSLEWRYIDNNNLHLCLSWILPCIRSINNIIIHANGELLLFSKSQYYAWRYAIVLIFSACIFTINLVYFNSYVVHRRWTIMVCNHH